MVKTVRGDGNCTINSFSMFLIRKLPIFFLYYGTISRKKQENDLYVRFGEYCCTEELLKNLEDHVFNKRCNHKTIVFQQRSFRSKGPLTNSHDSIVGEKYNRYINVLKIGNNYKKPPRTSQQ